MPSHSSALVAGLLCLSAAVVVVPMPWLATAAAAGEGSISGPDCQTSCGGVDIPFPFGIGPDHFWMPGFEISCKDTGNGILKPFMLTVNEDKAIEAVMEFLNISLEQGQAKVLHPVNSYCYNATSGKMVPDQWYWKLRSNYTFSSTANKFTVVGCRALAYIGNTGRNVAPMYKYQTGCVSMCFNRKMSLNPCSGNGCCQTTIPKGLKYYRVWFDEGFMNISGIDGGADLFGRCSFAVLMDSSDFPSSTSSSNISSPEFINNINSASQFFNSSRGGKAPVVLDWSIGEDNCTTAQTSPGYACVSGNSSCFNSASGRGYICNYSEGFHGNPYLRDGCQGFGSMKASGCGGIKEHLHEHEECNGSVLWFGASSLCLALMVSVVAPQDGLTQHSCCCPCHPYYQLQARQETKITTTRPPHFDLCEAIALGYQNNMELVSEAGQEGGINASSFLSMVTWANEHVIHIPPRTVLLKVMEAIGAKAENLSTDLGRYGREQ